MKFISFIIANIIFSLTLSAQVWTKIGAFTDFSGMNQNDYHTTSIAYNENQNKVYYAYISNPTPAKFKIKEYNGTLWNTIGVFPLEGHVGKVSLLSNPNDNNLYVLTADSFRIYNGSNWSSLPLLEDHSIDINIEESDMEINPLNNHVWVARINQEWVGSNYVLRVDEFNGTTWNNIDSAIINSPLVQSDNLVPFDFEFMPNGSAYITYKAYFNSMNQTYKMAYLNNNMITLLPQAIYSDNNSHSHDLFYNNLSGNMNLVTDEGNIYEIQNNSLNLLHSYSTELFLPSSTYFNNQFYLFKGGWLNPEINTYDNTYSLTPLDQPGFNLMEKVRFAQGNNKLFVSALNCTDLQFCNFMNELAVYKLDNVSAGLNDIKEKNNVSISPMPAIDFIKVQTPQGINYNYKLVDVLGKIVLSGELIDNTINLKELTNGIYYLSILNKDVPVSTQKIIKQD